jgi:hypothetical protein
MVNSRFSHPASSTECVADNSRKCILVPDFEEDAYPIENKSNREQASVRQRKKGLGKGRMRLRPCVS